MPPRAQAGILCIGLLGVLLALAPAAAEPTTQVYRVQHRVAAELLPLVETALAGQGSARADPATNSLVLTGEPRAIAVALELLVVQDRARRTVAVEAWSEQRSELAAAGYRIDWTPEPEALRLGRLEPASGVASGSGEAVLGAGGAARGSFRKPEHPEFASTLKILEDALGRIASGHVVPFVTRGEGGVTTAIIEARSGLLVRPHVLGKGHVQLDMAPFDGSAEDDGSASFASDSTRVVLGADEIAVVAGIHHEGRETDSARHRGSAGSPRDEALLLLRVRIE